MTATEETLLTVSFLRSEAETSTEALENVLSPVSAFFSREQSILKHELKEINVHRSGGRGSRSKDHGDGLLYEAPFAEAKFSVTFRKLPGRDGNQRSSLPYLYTAWCSSPPNLDAWLSRGSDQHLFEGFDPKLLKENIKLEELSLGVVINLTDFYPENIIDCTTLKSDDKNKPNVSAEANFDHVHKFLKIYITLLHTCDSRNSKAFSTFILDVEYSSIARTIVDLRKNYTDLYLRLTHPAILYGSEKDFGPDNLRTFRDFHRYNVLGCSEGCRLKINSRRLGGCNTLRLRWENKKGILLTLHTIFAKLQRSESVVASMATKEKPREGIRKLNDIMIDFFKRTDISFRAKYAVEACKLISFDLLRQLAILQREEIIAFLESLVERARYEGTHKMFEKTMFHLLKAIDEGNVVMYRDAMPSQFKKFERMERERRRKAVGDCDSEKPVQGMAIIYKVFLTPSRTILRPPEEHGENRILRQVNRDYMLRLVFRDDDLRSLTHSLKGTAGKVFLDCFLKVFLQQGVILANRKYDYLAASSSQLRDHGCWFYAEDDRGCNSATIRKEMGSFDEIENVGKKMAREGLCFSSTIETVKVEKEECLRERDIKGGKHPRSGKPYTFSDGIGKISAKLRDDVCEALADTLKGKKPSAFQIRYQGAKGMVALDPDLEGRSLVLRESMVKFECPPSASTSLEVIKCSEERSTTLNKQVITILEQLGVPAEVFIHYQETNIIDFADALLFESVASDRLTASVKKDPDCIIEFSKFREYGMSLIKDPYFRSMLIVLYKNIITNLRSKARISIPWSSGRNLLGVMDETGQLEHGQVYIRYTVREDLSGPDLNREDSKNKNPESTVKEDDENDPFSDEPQTEVLTGKVVVTKCPCVHPGDVRMLEAVDVPGLEHLVDVIVFPQKGPRPHPNEMAGSDLDGDEYAVIWDPRFFFKCKCQECEMSPRPDGNHEPMTFDDTPAEKKPNITLNDYYDFICNFIMTDNKGLISNAHLACADYEPDGIFSSKCLKLAEKVSVCLDFAKTGRLTELEADERMKLFPDFMEKQDHKPSYCSEKVLGRLYRTCRALENTASMSSIECDERYCNESFRIDGWETMKDKAVIFVKKYEQRLTKIMEHMGIQSEAEIMVSIVNQVGKYMSKGFHEIEELQEQLERQRSYLNKQMKDDFIRIAGLSEDAQWLFASACYMVVYNPPGDEKYTHFYGAPWILFKHLTDCSALNDHLREDIPNCPLARSITEAINAQVDPELSMTEKAMVIIRDWAEAEGLLGEGKQVAICHHCLYSIYIESKKSVHEMEIEPSLGANVLLFVRYCAIDFRLKAQGMPFDRCNKKDKCAMHRKEPAIIHRMTAAAIGTYSALAVSGDVCAIKGLPCGKEHGKRALWSAKHVFPLVLNIRERRSQEFLADNRSIVAEILKKWCDAEPDDRIALHFEDSKGNRQVEVIVETKEWVRHTLEDRLYRLPERVLIEELEEEMKKMGEYRQTRTRVRQNLH